VISKRGVLPLEAFRTVIDIKLDRHLQRATAGSCDL
jgi:hypothetical protein